MAKPEAQWRSFLNRGKLLRERLVKQIYNQHFQYVNGRVEIRAVNLFSDQYYGYISFSLRDTSDRELVTTKEWSRAFVDPPSSDIWNQLEEKLLRDLPITRTDSEE